MTNPETRVPEEQSFDSTMIPETRQHSTGSKSAVAMTASSSAKTWGEGRLADFPGRNDAVFL